MCADGGLTHLLFSNIGRLLNVTYFLLFCRLIKFFATASVHLPVCPSDGPCALPVCPWSPKYQLPSVLAGLRNHLVYQVLELPQDCVPVTYPMFILLHLFCLPKPCLSSRCTACAYGTKGLGYDGMQILWYDKAWLSLALTSLVAL